MKLSLGKKIAGVAVAGAVLVGAGTMAWADSNGATTAAPAATIASTSTAPASSGTGSAKGAHKGRGLLQRADYGTIEIKVKGSTTGSATWQTFTFDRGKVTTVSAGQITLARPDGKSVTLTINASTKYQGVTSWQQIATSKRATVISTNGTATIIEQRVAPATGTGGPSPSTTTAPAA